MKTLRTILMGILALAAIIAAATFLLPAKVSVQRSADIARPPSLVYALVSDLNGFNQYSPWLAADPGMTNSISGGAGPGQKMTWNSAKMGKGAMVITDAKPYETVNMDLDFGASKAKSSFVLKPTETGSAVTWLYEASAGLNPITRVMNLVTKGFVAKDYDAGLAKLKTLAEALPNVDLSGLSVSMVDLPARPFIYYAVETSNADPAAARAEILRNMRKAEAVLILNDVNPSGPGVILEVERGNGLVKVHAGFPIDKAPTIEEASKWNGAANAVFGELPGGKMARAPSPAKNSEKTFQQLQVYLKLMKLQAKGPAQEAFPAGAAGDTEIFIPVS